MERSRWRLWRRRLLETQQSLYTKEGYYKVFHSHKAVDAVHGTRKSSGDSALCTILCGSGSALARHDLRLRRRGETARRQFVGMVADTFC